MLKQLASKINLLFDISITDLQICEHPRSGTCTYGARVVLSLSAVGSEPLQYKWKKNGEDIIDPKCTGISTPILTIHSFSQDHQGNFSCIVSSNQKSIQSKHANLALGMK